MGQLRNATVHDKTSFPGADFAAFNSVPIVQCEDAVFSAEDGVTVSGPNSIQKTALMNPIKPTSDELVITKNPSGPIGVFQVIGTGFSDWFLDHDPGTGSGVHWYLRPKIPPQFIRPPGVATTTVGQLVDPGKFAGWQLGGRICVITTADAAPLGEYSINYNDDNVLDLHPHPGISANVEYYIKSNKILTEPRTVQRIMEAAQAEGAATMIKGGQLFIDGILTDIQPACRIVLNPA